MEILIVLLVILMIAVTLALADIALYAQLGEEIGGHGPDAEEKWAAWMKTPDGRMARRPLGALYLYTRNQWRKRNS